MSDEGSRVDVGQVQGFLDDINNLAHLLADKMLEGSAVDLFCRLELGKSLTRIGLFNDLCEEFPRSASQAKLRQEASRNHERREV